MPMNHLLSISDLESRARRRIPHYAWEYLDSGTGSEECLDRNRRAFARISLVPRFLRGEFHPNIETALFGTRYAAPLGIAPVGLSSMIWPNAETILAKTAATHRIPYVLSTVANQSPEVVGPIVDGMGWFQLYPPRDEGLRKDLLARARDAGFGTLVVTADVPAVSRRERQVRADLSIPPRITLRMLYWSAIRPRWLLETLMSGQPRFRTLEKYVDASEMQQVTKYIGENLGGTLSWDYLAKTRDEWQGPLVLKGILHPKDAERAIAVGVDGIVVSNHGGRQFDGAPAPLSVLPEIRAAVGTRAAILFDSGIRGALDIARAIALGADFVLLGRAFMFGVAALGRGGGNHTAAILTDELTNVMRQLGCQTIEHLSRVTWRDDAAPQRNQP